MLCTNNYIHTLAKTVKTRFQPDGTYRFLRYIDTMIYDEELQPFVEGIFRTCILPHFLQNKKNGVIIDYVIVPYHLDIKEAKNTLQRIIRQNAKATHSVTCWMGERDTRRLYWSINFCLEVALPNCTTAAAPF